MCSASAFVPKVESGEWADVPKGKLGEQRGEDNTMRLVFVSFDDNPPLLIPQTGTYFTRLYPEEGVPAQNPEGVKKVIFCTGKVYYELLNLRSPPRDSTRKSPSQEWSRYDDDN